MQPFSDFQYDFRSSRSMADLLIVVFDRNARDFNRSGTTELQHLIYPRLSTEFGMLVFFTNLIEFQVRYLALFLLFSVICGFRLLWTGNLEKNIPLMLKFPKGLFLVLQFSKYTLIIFMVMLSVIVLSLLMILLSTLNVIKHLICGNNQNWLLNLNVTYKTLWTGAGIGLLILKLKKLSQFCLTSLKALALLM